MHAHQHASTPLSPMEYNSIGSTVLSKPEQSYFESLLYGGHMSEATF